MQPDGGTASDEEDDMIKELLAYYGNGEEVFGDVIRAYRAAVDGASEQAVPLAELMTKHGSDKDTWHNYPLFYSHLFTLLPQPVKAVLEFGLGTNNTDVVGNMGEDGKPGASLRAWRDFFPDAIVYGADYDVRVLFDDNRIHTFYLDQTSVESIQNAWSLMPHLFFDLVIDDGAHAFLPNSLSLDNTYARVRPGGLYIIEDIIMEGANFERFDQYFQSRGWDAVLIRLPHDENHMDNAVAVVRL